jgi:hypothetical protein
MMLTERRSIRMFLALGMAMGAIATVVCSVRGGSSGPAAPQAQPPAVQVPAIQFKPPLPQPPAAPAPETAPQSLPFQLPLAGQAAPMPPATQPGPNEDQIRAALLSLPQGRAATAEIIRRRFAELAAPEDAVRETARADLLALRPSDLQTLLEIVKQSIPLQPSQAAVLHEIVTHVYLTGRPYPSDPDHGFLGIRMGPLDGVSDDGDGIEVLGRIPGFIAFRQLQDGDILRSVVADATHLAAVLRSAEDVKDSVNEHRRSGDVIVFEVLRRGRLIRVPLALDARPLRVNALGGDDFISSRQEDAEAFWDKEFAALIEPTIL